MQTRKRLTGQVILIIKAVKILAREHKPPFDNIQPLTNLEHTQVIDHAYVNWVEKVNKDEWEKLLVILTRNYKDKNLNEKG